MEIVIGWKLRAPHSRELGIDLTMLDALFFAEIGALELPEDAAGAAGTL